MSAASLCERGAGIRERRKTRILLCGPSRDAVSGVATHIDQIFRSSIATKYSLCQFRVGSEGRREGPFRRFARFVASPLALAREILRWRPEIVHLNTSLVPRAYWRDLMYLVIAKSLGCKAVYQVHGGALPQEFLGRNVCARRFLRWSLRIPDVIVLLAEIERKAYEDFALPTPIHVIPNAIHLDEYRTATPKSFDEPRTIVGYTGRLALEKGIAEAIRALAILRRAGIDTVLFRIAGSGPSQRELRELVHREGVSDAVEFLGPVFGDAKIRFWQGIDLFLFPTKHKEGLPYTILEALASATPILTTRVGGIPDVIEDGVHGTLLSECDPAAIAGALRSLLADRRRLRCMSGAALQRAREHYGIDRLAAQFDCLYQQMRVGHRADQRVAQ